jgi:SAM-dependent methyltransferase
MRYQNIVEHYESCFEKHGDNHKGVDWPNAKDARSRYKVMKALMQPDKGKSLLDLGCGAGHFLEYLIEHDDLTSLEYTGADLSEVFISHCKNKFPDYTWMQLDVLKDPQALSFDYVVMNGIFTEKLEATQEAMWVFLQQMLNKVWAITNVGMAFNVMSTQVDWQRDDLFHVPMDDLGDYLHQKISNHYVIRRDYGLYEYTVYVYKSSTL